MKAKLKIIGTSHISPESIRQIESTIKKEKPDCVAVELDPGRLEGLLRKQTIGFRSISQIGVRNFFVAKIFSSIQRYLGRKTGVMPGEEMLTAVNIAREIRADLALIDQNILVTLERMRSIPFIEKLKLFFSLFKKSNVDEKIDLRKVPLERVVEKVLDELKKISPNLYKVLVEERDTYMANHLFNLSQKYNKIVAVVGVGHRKGILKALKELEEDKEKLDKKIMHYKRRTGRYSYL
ncbi:TPA: TraB family protein [archaeon]|uniref:TraB family protein n=1 Tax=Candidatus Naiadarchaeum limnaeum TaxID=2756139 RepID=A0A832USE7_9ARCH|nr:TraB family protein [Candidatus Naiadarchaeales archaeon SRR2090153.bin1042]HIK00677.1 TraB family protein [Candidatus Naiadarchaeum limnaeum]